MLVQQSYDFITSGCFQRNIFQYETISWIVSLESPIYFKQSVTNKSAGLWNSDIHHFIWIGSWKRNADCFPKHILTYSCMFSINVMSQCVSNIHDNLLFSILFTKINVRISCWYILPIIYKWRHNTIFSYNEKNIILCCLNKTLFQPTNLFYNSN